MEKPLLVAWGTFSAEALSACSLPGRSRSQGAGTMVERLPLVNVGLTGRVVLIHSADLIHRDTAANRPVWCASPGSDRQMVPKEQRSAALSLKRSEPEASWTGLEKELRSQAGESGRPAASGCCAVFGAVLGFYVYRKATAPLPVSLFQDGACGASRRDGDGDRDRDGGSRCVK